MSNRPANGYFSTALMETEYAFHPTAAPAVDDVSALRSERAYVPIASMPRARNRRTAHPVAADALPRMWSRELGTDRARHLVLTKAAPSRVRQSGSTPPNLGLRRSSAHRSPRATAGSPAMARLWKSPVSCCQPDPRHPAHAPGCRSRGRAATRHRRPPRCSWGRAAIVSISASEGRIDAAIHESVAIAAGDAEARWCFARRRGSDQGA
jgi:hypothetical protein